tara:strand:- start:218 stop:952 length:735 start_codon:yes stop_codon:yes gene_type:complete
MSAYKGLKTHVLESPGTPTHSFIFLHGYTCSGKENASHCKSWSHANTTAYSGLRVVCPDAMKLKTSAPGYGRKKERSWYDFAYGECDCADDQPDLETLNNSCSEIRAIIKAEAEVVGSYSRVLLGGVSQGCCTAFHVLSTLEHTIGGFYGSIGHVMPCTDVSKIRGKVSGPLMFFCGSSDPVYPWSWVRDTFARLEGIPGVELWKEDHIEHEDDGHWLSIFLARIMPPPSVKDQLFAYDNPGAP